MFQVSTNRALRRDVDYLREQVLDLGEEVTRLLTHVAQYRQAFVAAFTEAGRPLPQCLRDDPDRPELTVIHGGAR